MYLPRTSIYLSVVDAGQSAAFYEALLGAPPTSTNARVVVFKVDAPAFLLTLETRVLPPATSRTNAEGNSSREPRGARPRSITHNRFALVVPQPEQVGQTAIALRRAGARLRLQDQGLEARDPDGNEWRVRFVPQSQVRAIVELPMECDK